MKENEFELISCEKIKHIKIFLNDIAYRNYHFHSAFEILLVLRGTGRINLPGESIPVAPGSLILLNQAEAHEIDAQGSRMVTLIFQISRHFCRDYFPNLSNTRFSVHDLTDGFKDEPEALTKLREHLCCIARDYLREAPYFELDCIEGTISVFRMLLKKLPHSLLSENHRSAIRKRVERMSRFLGYVEEHYTEPIRLGDLAKLEGLTPTYVSHLFTEQLGISFQEYLNNLRFEHAVGLLHSPGLSVSEVALSSGFSDPKYLGKMMRQKMGCSTAEYCREFVHSEPQFSDLGNQTVPERHLSREEAMETLKHFSEYNGVSPARGNNISEAEKNT